MVRVRRDENFVPNLAAESNAANGTVVPLYADPTTHRLLVDASVGFDISSYDYISVAYAGTTDTFTYKTGGAGGTLVGTITITYTDSTKVNISTVVKT